ncbi:hypothetical protein GL50803_0016553 [Giardia duodenalis]|uniref:Uncharacterized protein n=1 Tax=Giardia intestinalis (strain ATCC 50803 / WB clone C6) TaxID=184922 RepID=A8BIY6_GIAIC|nr:hypothetical protein GL50803_0016553 [Giardia intestinalis]KAE8304901.1 hypothetical protein GL50803_0016553 [Giardia intestinalis]|eukprot:XP_001706706.1 Hypothetical protein GL50803_16553 [Giardia lamblia ATCC 50803]
MFSTADALDMGTDTQLSGIRTDLINAMNAKPRYILKTNANMVSFKDILSASEQDGSYMYAGITKPADRLLVSRLQLHDQALLIHSAPARMAGAHAIVEVAGRPQTYFDLSLRRQAHRVPLRYIRALRRVIPLKLLVQVGRELEIELFSEKRRLTIDQITEAQFITLLKLEESREEADGEATRPSDSSSHSDLNC